jgi:hypothetical protein
MSLSNFDLNQNYYSFSKNSSTPIVFIHGVGFRSSDVEVRRLKNLKITQL